MKKKPINLFILIATGVFLFFIITEIGMNYWIRSSIRRELIKGSGMESQATVRISWMNIRSFFGGKVNQIWIDAQNCNLNDLRYSRLTMDSRGFWFDLPELLFEKRLVIIRMEPTRIFALIDEPALNEYLALRYPELNCNLRVRSGGVILSGWALVFNNRVSIELEGDLKVIAERRLRFFPTRLMIADRKLTGTLLKIVGEQLPMEFEIMEGWPLKINSFKLHDRKIEIALEGL